MAAEVTRRPAKGQAKVRGKAHGRMPSKRTINLMVVDENKIKPLQAIPAVLAVLVLAAVFSKFLVVDRLTAMSQAQSRVTRLQATLDEAKATLDAISDVDKTYAHYTFDGMTAQEMGLVDRTGVLDLVIESLPPTPPGPKEEDLPAIANQLFRRPAVTGNDSLDAARQLERLSLLAQLVIQPEYVINSWSVTDNLLTLEVTGQTLERMNVLAQQIERDPIVNRCIISTANMDIKRDIQGDVQARFIVYLQQAAEVETDNAADEESASGSGMPNFRAVTQFVGGEVSEP